MEDTHRRRRSVFLPPEADPVIVPVHRHHTPDDFDSGTIWIAYQVLAAVIAVGSLAACVDSMATSVVVAVVWAVVAAGGLVGLVVGFHHRRRLAVERLRLGAADELLSYRQDSMPWAYWCAAGLVGTVGVTAVIAAVDGVVRGTSGVSPIGGVVWAGVVYATVWIYGRRAFELRLVDDGIGIEVRAPLRTRRIYVRSVTTLNVEPTNSLLGERRGVVTLTSGERIRVVIPNVRHERRFLSFRSALSRRAAHATSGQA
jgi:hypothetical protein